MSIKPALTPLAIGLLVFMVAAVVVGLIAVRSATDKYRAAFAEARLMAALPTARALSQRESLPPSWSTGANKVLVLGDSRVAQWSPVPTSNGHTFLLRGVPGETTWQLRARFSAELAFAMPDVVVVAAGINDLVAASMNPAYREHIRTATIDNLNAMHGIAHDFGVEFIAVEVIQPAKPSAMRAALAWSDEIHADVAAVNKAVLAWARDGGLRVIYANRALGVDSETGHLPRTYAADTLHFNRDAYIVLNTELSRALGP